MALNDCVNEIIKATDGQLTDDEIEAIAKTLEERAKARQAGARKESAEEAMLNAADDVARDIDIATQIAKRNEAINIVTRAKFREFLKFVDVQTGDPAAAFRAWSVGSNQRFEGARDSVAARTSGLMAEFGDGMVYDLRKAGLFSSFTSRRLDREIAQELWEVSRTNGERGVSGSQDAAKIAEIVDKYRKLAVSRENRAGAFIRDLDGYITRQSHDSVRMGRAGLEDWKAEIRDRLDVERTFQGADPEEFLDATYNALVSGIHLKGRGADEADVMFSFKGPGNLAKRASESRVLHFKTADDWYEYNQRFGRSSVTESIIHDFERASRNIALMETWGTNPRAMFDEMLLEAKETYRADPKKLKALNSNSLQNQFDIIDGTASIPQDVNLATIGAISRGVETLARLGGATLSSVVDPVFKVAVSRDLGASFLGGWKEALTTTVDGLPVGQRRLVGELIGVGTEGVYGSVAARFTAQDDVPGRITRMQAMFFKLNLLSGWTDAHKRGMGRMIARKFAIDRKTAYADLDERRIMELYGIDEAKWNVARKAVRKADDGIEYLVPSEIRSLSDRQVGAKGRAAQRIRDDVETAFRAMYRDLVDEATPTPGARERALMTLGQQPGTALGEGLRFLGQFKAFPTTVLMKSLGRRLGADTTGQFARNMISGKGDVLGLVNIILGTTILGYVAMSAKNIAKGLEPRDPTEDPLAVLGASALQGGGLGIFGDFLFGQYNRYGRSFEGTLAGPVIGSVGDILEIGSALFDPKDSSTASKAVRFTGNIIPFNNLFYTRMAFEHLILNEMQEAVNPGYLRRMERRIRRDTGQEFFLSPAG